MKGTVKFFNGPKHFGFITAEDGKDYFVHESGLVGNIRIKDDDAVTFDVEDGERGAKAVNVKLEKSSAPVKKSSHKKDTDEDFDDDVRESSEDF